LLIYKSFFRLNQFVLRYFYQNFYSIYLLFRSKQATYLMSVAPWVKAIKTFFLLFYTAMTVARYEIICKLRCFSFCKQSKNIFSG